MLKNLLIATGLIFITIISFSQIKPTQKSINKSLLIGIWTNGRTENATFEIDKDSIFYLESFQKYKYHVIGDSITIKFDGFDNTSRIEKVTKDSLILRQGIEKMTFWKFKD